MVVHHNNIFGRLRRLVRHWCGAFALIRLLLHLFTPAVLLGLDDPLRGELGELCHHSVQGELPVHLVVARAHIHCAVGLLLLTHHCNGEIEQILQIISDMGHLS